MDVPNGEERILKRTSSRVCFLLSSRRKWYIMAGSCRSDGGRTTNARVAPLEKRTLDFAPANSHADLEFITRKPDVLVRVLVGNWRSSGSSLPASSRKTTCANSGSKTLVLSAAAVWPEAVIAASTPHADNSRTGLIRLNRTSTAIRRKVFSTSPFGWVCVMVLTEPTP